MEPCTNGTLYKMVVQATLLFGAETWVMSPRIGNNIYRFHHRVDQRLVGMQPRRYTTGRWVYPPLEEAIPTVGL